MGEFACEVQFELAEVYETEGDLPKAAAEFRRVSELYPNSMVYADKSRWRAVALFENLGKKRDAMELYGKIAATNSNRAEEARQRIKELLKDPSLRGTK